MSMMEPGAPYFQHGPGNPSRHKPGWGRWQTSKGYWRSFPITRDAPCEAWCHHFEWGACTCGPAGDGEVFLKTGTVYPPVPLRQRLPFSRAEVLLLAGALAILVAIVMLFRAVLT